MEKKNSKRCLKGAYPCLESAGATKRGNRVTTERHGESWYVKKKSYGEELRKEMGGSIGAPKHLYQTRKKRVTRSDKTTRYVSKGRKRSRKKRKRNLKRKGAQEGRGGKEKKS